MNSSALILGSSDYVELTNCITMESAHQLMVAGLRTVYNSEVVPNRKQFLEGQIKQYGFFPNHIEFTNVPDEVRVINNPEQFESCSDIEAVDMAGLVEMSRLRHMEENSDTYSDHDIKRQSERVGRLAELFAKLAINMIKNGGKPPVSEDDLEAMKFILEQKNNNTTYH